MGPGQGASGPAYTRSPVPWMGSLPGSGGFPTNPGRARSGSEAARIVFGESPRYDLIRKRRVRRSPEKGGPVRPIPFETCHMSSDLANLASFFPGANSWPGASTVRTCADGFWLASGQAPTYGSGGARLASFFPGAFARLATLGSSCPGGMFWRGVNPRRRFPGSTRVGSYHAIGFDFPKGNTRPGHPVGPRSLGDWVRPGIAAGDCKGRPGMAGWRSSISRSNPELQRTNLNPRRPA